MTAQLPRAAAQVRGAQPLQQQEQQEQVQDASAHLSRVEAHVSQHPRQYAVAAAELGDGCNCSRMWLACKQLGPQQ